MIVIAPDSYKGTMSATEVCDIIKKEFLKLNASEKVKCFPIADGGEGTVDAMLFNGGKRIIVKIKGPLFDEAEAFTEFFPTIPLLSKWQRQADYRWLVSKKIRC